MSEIINRKLIRLQEHDYCSAGTYFVTICVKERKILLSHIESITSQHVGTGFHACPQQRIRLTVIGREVENTINYINIKYKNVLIDNYCIMPDHVHFLITLQQTDELSSDRRGSLSLRDVVSRFKTYTTKQYRKIENNPEVLLWQSRYYDHVIRNDEDYKEKYDYITNNPVKWFENKNNKNLEE